MIDIHSHLIPGVDDGAVDEAEARKALAALRAQGVIGVIATPHVDSTEVNEPAMLARRLRDLDEGWTKLQAVATDFADLRVERGTELMLRSALPESIDPRLRLAGTRFLLVEFPGMAIPPDFGKELVRMRTEGWRPVIAHPERYLGAEYQMATMREWRGLGAYFQVNHGSLTGRYGPATQRMAALLLARGWIDFLASDYHARGRLPMAECRALLLRQQASAQFELLSSVNPRRLLDDELPLPVPEVPSGRRIWERIVGVFR